MASNSVKRIVRDIIIVCICVAAIWIGLQAYFGAENPFYVVSSGSMYPELMMYDIIIISGHIPFEDIRVGDIIVFDRPKDAEKVIVHRVVAVFSEDPKTLRTKGDNNQSSMVGTDFPITEDLYHGKVIHVIPQVGYVTKILQPPVNYIIIAIIIGVVIIREITKKKKEIKLDDSDFKKSESNEWNEFSKDQEYTESKGMIDIENKSDEDLDNKKTKSDENTPEFFIDKDRESEEKKE